MKRRIAIAKTAFKSNVKCTNHKEHQQSKQTSVHQVLHLKHNQVWIWLRDSNWLNKKPILSNSRNVDSTDDDEKLLDKKMKNRDVFEIGHTERQLVKQIVQRKCQFCVYVLPQMVKKLFWQWNLVIIYLLENIRLYSKCHKNQSSVIFICNLLIQKSILLLLL